MERPQGKGSNTAIAELDVLNNEIGSVQFTPKEGKEYVISITDNTGKVNVIDIPQSRDTGTTLTVQLKNDKIKYTIHTKNIPSNGTGYTLIGTIHDELVFLGNIKKSNGIVTGNIDSKNLRTGVLRLTLLDEAENPVNERLCFFNQQVEAIEPDIKTNIISFAPKGHNRWEIAVDSVSWLTYSVQINDAAYPIEAGSIKLPVPLPLKSGMMCCLMSCLCLSYSSVYKFVESSERS